MTENTKKKSSFIQSEFVKRMLKNVVAVVVTASLLLNFFTFVVSVVQYYGTSMQPTLEEGQILIVSKISEIESGDIIAFYYNNKVLVRRVVATGNQQVFIDVFGNVMVNGKELDESYIENKTLGQCNLNFPYSVPSGSYFVLGDNREVSMDSRLEEIGSVSSDRLIGKVVFATRSLGSIE